MPSSGPCNFVAVGQLEGLPFGFYPAKMASLNLDLPGAVSMIRRADNPRGIVYKSRVLIDFLIGEKTKTAKFQPYTGRVFKQVAEKMEIKYNLKALLLLQTVITNVELQMNSCSIAEAVLLQTAIGNFIIENKAE